MENIGNPEKNRHRQGYVAAEPIWLCPTEPKWRLACRTTSLECKCRAAHWMTSPSNLPPPSLTSSRLLTLSLNSLKLKKLTALNGGQMKQRKKFRKSGDLASFHYGSSCAYGTGVWGIWTKTNKRKVKFLYAKVRTARRTIPDQELSSMHQSVQISRVFQKILPGLLLGDSEVSHKQICSINCPKDTWTMNRVRAILSNGVDVSFYHIKSEDNLPDRISKPGRFALVSI